jgi:hypothetical protein
MEAKMKKLLVIFAILSIGFAGILSGCIQKGQGTLVIKLTDAPSDLNITEALITMSSLQVHYAGVGEENDSFGEWITIVNESQTFDLITLQNASTLFGSAVLQAGIYTQIRLNVDQALVTIDGIQYDLKIPSKKIKLIKPFQVLENDTLTLILDFDIQKSIHQSVSDKYILRPTIKVIQE